VPHQFWIEWSQRSDRGYTWQHLNQYLE